MTLEELRALLAAHDVDPLRVVARRHDGADVVARAPLDGWRVWEHDGIVDVGSEDRGRWVSTRQFATESEAFEYLAGVLTQAAPRPESAEHRTWSEDVTARETERLRRLIDDV